MFDMNKIMLLKLNWYLLRGQNCSCPKTIGVLHFCWTIFVRADCISFNWLHWTSINFNQHQSISVYIYQPLSTSINLNQPLLTYVSSFQLLSTITDWQTHSLTHSGTGISFQPPISTIGFFHFWFTSINFYQPPSTFFNLQQTPST